MPLACPGGASRLPLHKLTPLNLFPPFPSGGEAATDGISQYIKTYLAYICRSVVPSQAAARVMKMIKPATLAPTDAISTAALPMSSADPM